jgi:hypothetical protein
VVVEVLVQTQNQVSQEVLAVQEEVQALTVHLLLVLESQVKAMLVQVLCKVEAVVLVLLGLARQVEAV